MWRCSVEGWERYDPGPCLVLWWAFACLASSGGKAGEYFPSSFNTFAHSAGPSASSVQSALSDATQASHPRSSLGPSWSTSLTGGYGGAKVCRFLRTFPSLRPSAVRLFLNQNTHQQAVLSECSSGRALAVSNVNAPPPPVFPLPSPTVSRTCIRTLRCRGSRRSVTHRLTLVHCYHGNEAEQRQVVVVQLRLVAVAAVEAVAMVAVMVVVAAVQVVTVMVLTRRTYTFRIGDLPYECCR